MKIFTNLAISAFSFTSIFCNFLIAESLSESGITSLSLNEIKMHAKLHNDYR